MRFCALGSGSGGNAYIVEHDETTLLVDCGFSLSELMRRLAACHLSLTELDAIVISHEHNDHIAGINTLKKKYDIPCYMSAGTARSLVSPVAYCCMTAGDMITIGSLVVRPIPVPHDVVEPLQFVIEGGESTLAIFTDLGHITAAVTRELQAADAIILECNYDENMLRRGHYPVRLKERIMGRYGHLSNACAATLLAQTKTGKRREVVAAHLSQENNSPALVNEALICADSRANITIANQDSVTAWLQV